MNKIKVYFVYIRPLKHWEGGGETNRGNCTTE